MVQRTIQVEQESIVEKCSTGMKFAHIIESITDKQTGNENIKDPRRYT